MGKQEILNDLTSGTFTDDELNEIANSITTKRLKINLITVNIGGDQFEFLNNSTTPNTKLFDGVNGIPNNPRRYANRVTIRCRTTDEDKIFSTVVSLVSLMGTWGYAITERQRNIDPQDASKITNILTLEQRPINIPV